MSEKTVNRRPLPPSAHQRTASHHDDLLPAYSGPSVTPIPSRPTVPSIPGLPNIDFSRYQLSESSFSDDQTTITTTYAVLSSNPNALKKFLHEQAAVPPKPQIRIFGSHGDADRKTDFDLLLNMMPYIIRPEADAWHYLKVVNDTQKVFRGGSTETTQRTTQSGMDEWIQRYCEDSSANKTFTLERIVTNWDQEYIEGKIRAIIATTKYRGQVTVEFPTSHSKVVVQAPRTGNLAANFMSLFKKTNKYEVVNAIWPYSSLAPNVGDVDGARTWAVKSEAGWWNEWKDAIRGAVLAKRRGWVTVEDYMEFMMGPRKDLKQIRDWGG